MPIYKINYFKEDMRCNHTPLTNYLIMMLLICSTFTFAQNENTVLNTERIDEIRFNSNNFSITGSLYIPKVDNSKKIPLVIWISGSGPSYRTVKSPEAIKVINCFLNSGFAYFRIDKPGCGDSKGILNDDSLFAELSDVVVSAVDKLKGLPFIDPGRIGLFGSSQAGYIMPLAISKCKEIAFMIGSSCPGENSIEQWNYLLEKQMICEGYTEEEARNAVKMFSTLRLTTDKKEFDIAISYFTEHPMVLKSLNYDSTFTEKAKNWWPREINFEDESFFNPITLVEKITIPVFLIYGDHDTQVDPHQAVYAYEGALRKAQNPFYKLKMISGADHNMSISKSGCLYEIAELNRSGTYSVSKEYIETLNEWLANLNSEFQSCNQVN